MPKNLDSPKDATSFVYALIAAFSNLFSVRSQKGVTMIEYALIAALVAVVVIAALTTLGSDLTSIFTQISTKLQGAGS